MSSEAKKKLACISSGLCDCYSEYLHTNMAALKFENDIQGFFQEFLFFMLLFACFAFLSVSYVDCPDMISGLIM